LHSVWDTGLVREVIEELDEDTTQALVTKYDSLRTQFQAVTDAAAITKESFQLAKDEVYAKGILNQRGPNGRAASIPVFPRYVDVSPRECDTEAPARIRNLTVDGEESYSTDETHAVIEKQLYKAGVRLARILETVFQ